MGRHNILLYAESGFGKTTQINRLAQYYHERHGKKSLVITYDSGIGPMFDGVQQGYLEVWRANTLPLGFKGDSPKMQIMRKGAKGFWPTKLNSDGTWSGNLKQIDFAKEQIGLFAVEGAYMLCEAMQVHLVNNRQQQTGEPLQGQFEEGDEKFAGSSRGTIGYIQHQLITLISHYKELPVDCFLMTSHETKKGKDETGVKTLGPAAIGGALTNKIGAHFTMLLHGKVQRNIEHERMIYFQPHTDAELKMNWPSKLSGTLKQMSILQRFFPDGRVPCVVEHDEITQGLHTILDLLDFPEDYPHE